MAEVKLLTDITPLREYPAFRRLWLGSMLSQTGSAMTNFALTLQVWDMTRSTAAVGGLGVATLVPMLLIALPGGYARRHRSTAASSSWP